MRKDYSFIFIIIWWRRGRKVPFNRLKKLSICYLIQNTAAYHRERERAMNQQQHQSNAIEKSVLKLENKYSKINFYKFQQHFSDNSPPSIDTVPIIGCAFINA
jgi:hypothetical protein